MEEGVSFKRGQANARDRKIHERLIKFARIAYADEIQRMDTLEVFAPNIPIEALRASNELIEQAHREGCVNELIAKLTELMPDASAEDSEFNRI